VKNKQQQKQNAGVPPLRFASVGMTQFFGGREMLQRQKLRRQQRQKPNAEVPPAPLTMKLWVASVGRTILSWFQKTNS